MKIISLLVVGYPSEDDNRVILPEDSEREYKDPVILAKYSEQTSEFVPFIGRTVVKVVDSLRSTVQLKDYKVYCYKRMELGGLYAMGFMDNEYPLHSAFDLLRKVLNSYKEEFHDTWKSVEEDSSHIWPYFTKLQDPAEAAKLISEMDTIPEDAPLRINDHHLSRSVLDELVNKSSDLSTESKKLYKQVRNMDSDSTTEEILGEILKLQLETETELFGEESGESVVSNLGGPASLVRRGNLSENEPGLETVDRILNKLTRARMRNSETYDDPVLKDQLAEKSRADPEAVITRIVGRAVCNPLFSSLYAEWCSEINNQSENKMILVDSCLKTFGGVMKPTEELRQKSAPEANERRSVGDIRLKGCVRFMGQLLHQKLVPHRLALSSVEKLLATDAVCLEEVCRFVERFGKEFDSRGIKLDEIFRKLQKLTENPELHPCIILKVQNIIGMRSNDWVVRPLAWKRSTEAWKRKSQS